jgi:hypothetical protein
MAEFNINPEPATSMIQLAATTHAYQRARERTGWNRNALQRMLDRIFYFGVSANSPHKKLRDFLRNLPGDYADRDARAYGEHVFVFAHDAPGEAVLVTVLPLPHDIRAALAVERHWRP